MASRSSASSSAVKKRRTSNDPQVALSLLAQSSKTKKQLVDTLKILKDAGKLQEGMTKRDLTHASEHHANQQTSYGTVVQKIELGLPKLKFLDVCHPFAMLQYLCSISLPFGDMLYTAVQKAAGQPLRLVIYADEMCPGNPFRPEKSRTLQCIYWTFIDFPGYILSRTFAWPCLCLIRAKIIEGVEGAMSYICRVILRLFFPEDGESLADGIYVKVRDTTFIVTAVFAGFLCDLKGHKENTEWKGYNSNNCCLTCANIDKRITGDHGRGVYGLDCSDRDKFVYRTNEDVFEAVDELAAAIATGISKSAFQALQTAYGFNLCLGGILLDRTLRSIYKPVDHTLRDWMHTMCSDGVANSICGYTLQVLKAEGFTLESVRQFMVQVHLPSKYGKAHEEWLRDSRLKATTLTSFAGTCLTIVSILYLFMCQYCADRPGLADLFDCVQMLFTICGILSAGPDKPFELLAELKVLIPKLHAKYVFLFDHLKPKLHHMQHIIDMLEWCHKCLSCFVTERKHRVVKDAALHVMRFMEHTVLLDVVNQMCEQMTNGHDIFQKMFLVEPRECKLQTDILTSKRAILECGAVRSNDIVMFEDCACGRVLAFFLMSEALFVEVALMQPVNNDISLRDDTRLDVRFIECRLVVDSCMWHSTEQAGIIKVCVPPILTFKSI